MSTPQGPEQAKAINDIVDKVKKQGLFDQFRKECLANVDTKPAYQNLRQRVEAFVAQFLSGQKWSEDLNKNQLRESLRKTLIGSAMFSTGVDHIVEQVVNPKIYKSFKPQIDKIVCEYLGINHEERENHQKMCEEHERQKRAQDSMGQQLIGSPNFAENPGVPSLMSVNIHGTQQQTMIPSYPDQNFPPGMTSPFSSPVAQAFPGMPPPGSYAGLTSMPPMPGCPPSGLPGAPIPGYPGFVMGPTGPVFSGMPPNQTPPKDEKKEKKKKELEPLTVESLLNIPLPKEEPKKQEKKTKEPDKLSSGKQTPCDDTPQDTPHIEEEMIVDCEISQGNTLEASYVENGEHVLEETVDEGEVIQQVIYTEDMAEHKEGDETESVKKYQFAWDEDIEEDKLSVSSVHTSDLSSFADSDPGDHNDGEITDPAVETEKSQDEDASADSSPTKSRAEVPAEIQEESPNEKPRRLISLQYNLSDSEDDETREERKARIAREREERTARRQQRRAELEAKRKERGEIRKKIKTSVDKLDKGLEEDDEDLDRLSKTKSLSPTKKTPKPKVSTEETDESEKDVSLANTSKDVMSPQSSPMKTRRRTKQALKEEIREQKMKEKQMALRRHRTKNKRYMSEEFTSIFKERKNLLSGTEGIVINEDGVHQEVLIPEGMELEVVQLAMEGDEKNQQTIDADGNIVSTTQVVLLTEDGTQLQVEGQLAQSAEEVQEMQPGQPLEPPPLPESEESAEMKSRSQRYDASDLYKPRTSYSTRRRRGLSPPPPEPAPVYSGATRPTRKRRKSSDSAPSPSPGRSGSRSSWAPSSRDSSVSSYTSRSRSRSRSMSPLRKRKLPFARETLSRSPQTPLYSPSRSDSPSQTSSKSNNRYRRKRSLTPDSRSSMGRLRKRSQHSRSRSITRTPSPLQGLSKKMKKKKKKMKKKKMRQRLSSRSYSRSRSRSFSQPRGHSLSPVSSASSHRSRSRHRSRQHGQSLSPVSSASDGPRRSRYHRKHGSESLSPISSESGHDSGGERRRHDRSISPLSSSSSSRPSKRSRQTSRSSEARAMDKMKPVVDPNASPVSSASSRHSSPESEPRRTGGESDRGSQPFSPPHSSRVSHSSVEAKEAEEKGSSLAGESAEEGKDDDRPRRPIEEVDFGEAAKQLRPPIERVDFGLAAKQSFLDQFGEAARQSLGGVNPTWTPPGGQPGLRPQHRGRGFQRMPNSPRVQGPWRGPGRIVGSSGPRMPGPPRLPGPGPWQPAPTQARSPGFSSPPSRLRTQSQSSETSPSKKRSNSPLDEGEIDDEDGAYVSPEEEGEERGQPSSPVRRMATRQSSTEYPERMSVKNISRQGPAVPFNKPVAQRTPPARFIREKSRNKPMREPSPEEGEIDEVVEEQAGEEIEQCLPGIEDEHAYEEGSHDEHEEGEAEEGEVDDAPAKPVTRATVAPFNSPIRATHIRGRGGPPHSHLSSPPGMSNRGMSSGRGMPARRGGISSPLGARGMRGRGIPQQNARFVGAKSAMGPGERETRSMSAARGAPPMTRRNSNPDGMPPAKRGRRA